MTPKKKLHLYNSEHQAAIEFYENLRKSHTPQKAFQKTLLQFREVPNIDSVLVSHLNEEVVRLFAYNVEQTGVTRSYAQGFVKEMFEGVVGLNFNIESLVSGLKRNFFVFEKSEGNSLGESGSFPTQEEAEAAAMQMAENHVGVEFIVMKAHTQIKSKLTTELTVL
jgi:hypothetical protein